MDEKNWNLCELGYSIVTNLNDFFCYGFPKESPGIGAVVFGIVAAALLSLKLFSLMSFIIGGAFILNLANYLSIKADVIEKRRDVGLVIQAAMNRQGISEEEMSAILKLPVSQVRKYEFGQIKYEELTYHQRHFLGKLLNISPDFFTMNENNWFYDMTYEEYEACMSQRENE